MSEISPPFSQQVRQCALRIRESGAAALGGLYDLTAVRLVRFAYTITGNQHDAEDAVSSSLLKVATDVDLILTATNPWAYLLQIVRNESLLILRKKSRWSFAQGLFDFLHTAPNNELEQAESANQVTQALQKIPKDQAEVVVLKIWEELTFQEIAAVLNIPTQTAASRYRYAISKLSVLLGTNAIEVPL